jgi:hypothetical protein
VTRTERASSIGKMKIILRESGKITTFTGLGLPTISTKTNMKESGTKGSNMALEDIHMAMVVSTMGPMYATNVMAKEFSVL